jgi:hypothetical protein
MWSTIITSTATKKCVQFSSSFLFVFKEPALFNDRALVNTHAQILCERVFLRTRFSTMKRFSSAQATLVLHTHKAICQQNNNLSSSRGGAAATKLAAICGFLLTFFGFLVPAVDDGASCYDHRRS